MAAERKDFIMNVERVMTMPVRISYKFARDHILVFSSVVFLLILYSSCPSLFAFLVSTSPILVCTTLLLGLLLSYGEPNARELQQKNNKKQEVFPLKSQVITTDVHIKKYGNFTMENHAIHRPEVKEFAVREPLFGEGDSKFFYQKEEAIYTQGAQYREIETAASKSSGNDVERATSYEEKVTQEGGPQSEEISKSREIRLEKLDEVSKELGKDFGALSAVCKEEGPSLMFEIHDGSLGLPWQRVNSQDDFSDFESDRAESSSPDASMTDITPMLDDLDPLLNVESSQNVLVSKDDENAASQESSLDDDSDDNSDDEGAEKRKGKEDEVHKEKNDGSEAVVKWTADDQKNVMDLGYSVAEMNEKLELLIATQKERMNLASLKGRNLIELDEDEELTRFLFQIPPIFAPRRNPFDPHFDSEETEDLPPIPGSAPSSFLPRRNPFDVFLYDQQDETSNLVGETRNRQEHIPVPTREFRRNETFNLGRREFAQERRHSLMKPYFTAERTDSEEGSSSFYQRQFSDKSQSKVSTVPESDSVSSFADPEYLKEFVDEELHQESELPVVTKHDVRPVGHVSMYSEEEEFVDVEAKADHENHNHGIHLGTNLVARETYQGNGAFGSALEALKFSFVDKTSFGAGLDAGASLRSVMQIGTSGADSSPRPLTENSSSSAIPAHKVSFNGSELLERTESLDSLGYSSLSELQSDLRCASSSDLYQFRSDTIRRKQEKDLINLDSSEEESEVIHPMMPEPSEIDEGYLSESDAMGDFHTRESTSDHQGPQLRLQTDSAFIDYVSLSSYVHDEQRTQISAGRSTLYNDMSVGSVSEATFHNSNEVHSISGRTKIMESGVGFSFGSFNGDLEQTVYNPKQRVLQVDSVQEVDSESKSSVPDSNVTVKSGPMSSETNISNKKMEKTLPESEQMVLEAQSTKDVQSAFKQIKEEVRPTYVVPEVQTFQHLHDKARLESLETYPELHVLEAKFVDDSTSKKASKAAEPIDRPVEVKAGERNLELDALNMQYARDINLPSKEAVSKETNLEGEMKVQKSGAKKENHVSGSLSSTSKKVYKIAASIPRNEVESGSHQNGVDIRLKTGQSKKAEAPSQASGVNARSTRLQQKVIQKWRRVTPPTQNKQDNMPSESENAPAKVAGDEVMRNSNPVQQQQQDNSLVDIPQPNSIQTLTINLTLAEGDNSAEKVPEPLDQMLVQSQEQEEENNERLRLENGAIGSSIDGFVHDLGQGDLLAKEMDTGILEPPVVAIDNGLEPMKVIERSNSQQQLQQQEEKKKKKKKKKGSKNSRNYCFHCGEPDHQRDSCPLGLPVCYHCQQTGHGFKECPKKLQEEAVGGNTIETETQMDALTQEDDLMSSSII